MHEPGAGLAVAMLGAVICLIASEICGLWSIPVWAFGVTWILLGAWEWEQGWRQ